MTTKNIFSFTIMTKIKKYKDQNYLYSYYKCRLKIKIVFSVDNIARANARAMLRKYFFKIKLIFYR